MLPALRATRQARCARQNAFFFLEVQRNVRKN